MRIYLLLLFLYGGLSVLSGLQFRENMWVDATYCSLSPQRVIAFSKLFSSMFMWYVSKCTPMLGAPTSFTSSIACTSVNLIGSSISMYRRRLNSSNWANSFRHTEPQALCSIPISSVCFSGVWKIRKSGKPRLQISLFEPFGLSS